MKEEVLARMNSSGPKRILSLDGGGIRGCTTIGFLERMETVVRERMHGDATLSDYFDLIGGTSTGAIIATLLALGKSVSEVKDYYLELGPKVFSQPRLLARIPFVGRKLFTAWSVKPLEAEAKRLFSEKTTLGSPSIETGLCIVTKRADTFSTWPYINHPKARFYTDNCEIPLWKLIRASSAAPTYFRPIRLDVGGPREPDYGVFIDGGVSMANNPALQLFLVATLDGFPFHWRTGSEDLLLVSIGTGNWKQELSDEDILRSENLFWAKNVPELLMQDASDNNELLLQYLSNSPTARLIDWEVGDLSRDLIGGAEHLTYIRYDVTLERSKLEEVGIGVTEPELNSLRDMSAGSNAQTLYEIGQAFAEEQVLDSHLPLGFDPG